MTERLPRLVFVTLALACSLAAPSTWAVTGKNSCRSSARIVDAGQMAHARLMTPCILNPAYRARISDVSWFEHP